MSSIQRRLGLLVAAFAAFMAMAAAPALAVDDFPHEEQASKWSAILAYDYNGSAQNAQLCDAGASGGANCSFEASGPAKQVLWGYSINCGTTTIKGDVSMNGNVEVTSTTGNCLGSSTSGAGRICQHTATREYWIRYASGAGGSFFWGHLTVDASGLATNTPTHHPRGISFGNAADNIYTAVSGSPGGVTFQQAEYDSVWDEQELTLGAEIVGGKPVACTWSELS